MHNQSSSHGTQRLVEQPVSVQVNQQGKESKNNEEEVDGLYQGASG
jgi:hypothetical protein